MKFSPIVIYTAVSLSCYAMDTTGDARPSRDKSSEKNRFVNSSEQGEKEQKILKFKLKMGLS